MSPRATRQAPALRIIMRAICTPVMAVAPVRARRRTAMMPCFRDSVARPKSFVSCRPWAPAALTVLMARSVAWSWPPRTPRASWPCCSARAMAGVMRMKITTTMPIVTAVVSTRMGSRTAMSMRLPMSMMVPSISSTREADDASRRRTESLVTRVVSSPAGRLVSGSTLPVR